MGVDRRLKIYCGYLFWLHGPPFPELRGQYFGQQEMKSKALYYLIIMWVGNVFDDGIDSKFVFTIK